MNQAVKIASAASACLPEDPVYRLVAEVTTSSASEGEAVPRRALGALTVRAKRVGSLLMQLGKWTVVLIVGQLSILLAGKLILTSAPAPRVRTLVAVIGWSAFGAGAVLLIPVVVLAMRLVGKRKQIEIEPECSTGRIQIRKERWGLLV